MDDMTEFLLRLQDHAERVARVASDTCNRTKTQLDRNVEQQTRTEALLHETKQALDRVATVPARSPDPSPLPRWRRSAPALFALGIMIGLVAGRLVL